MKKTTSNAKRVYLRYGEGAAIARELNVTKQAVSAGIKRGNIDYLKALHEYRTEKESLIQQLSQ